VFPCLEKWMDAQCADIPFSLHQNAWNQQSLEDLKSLFAKRNYIKLPFNTNRKTL
jgi:hypothetical protein